MKAQYLRTLGENVPAGCIGLARQTPLIAPHFVIQKKTNLAQIVLLTTRLREVLSDASYPYWRLERSEC